MTVCTDAAMAKPKIRKKQPDARDKDDLGPWIDPIRQQGRDARHKYRPRAWYTTRQKCDRSRRCARARKYHQQYRTTSGHTHDHHYDKLALIAWELEAAGINLGWGGCADTVAGAGRVSESVEAEVRRRYADLLTVRTRS